MSSSVTFGFLSQKQFEFYQVNSLEKTFGNFAFGAHYPKTSMFAVASFSITARFVRSLILYDEISNIEDGKYEKITDKEIAFIFGNNPIYFSKQIILSTNISSKILITADFSQEVTQSIDLVGKVNSTLSIDNQIIVATDNKQKLSSQIILNEQISQNITSNSKINSELDFILKVNLNSTYNTNISNENKIESQINQKIGFSPQIISNKNNS